MEENKCAKCGMLLDDENRCQCEPTCCAKCCACDEDCECGCRKSDEKTDEE